MSIVAHTHPFVVGVDTHARNHVYTILTAATGAVVDTKDFPTTAAGINRALAWIARRTEADADTLWVIEGAASYGAILAGTVAAHGYPVAEAPRMDAKQHRGVGKSDALDAHRIAAAALPLPTTKLRRPRLSDGVRQAIQILVTARNAMSKDRTRSINALTALVRSNALGLDARAALNKTQILEVSHWRGRKEELSISIARAEAVRLAKHVLELEEHLATNEQQLDELVRISEAAPLLEEKGFQAISAAKCLAAWSHHGRISTEAEFASLAGVNPIPASSGNTVRYRLNRGGDRALNSALHMVTVSKMTHDAETRAYVEKRQAEHKTNREIRRCLKRYIARRVFRILNAQHKVLQPA
ncbi:IS110 family RNA-guided transposase [Enteractinococcus helveticum]|uniref:Transposase n=1 Tax=Enteractinococcus helveticum TaxID=1837282 RepID=A0A1B7M317_9MICC|nr:IS110 family transposase [Enteractinococcus helveticum]OAV62984.1 transposase [Enteractinococcus helveticum]